MATGISERDRRLQQRERERRERLITAGKQLLTTPGVASLTDRIPTNEERVLEQRAYEGSLEQQRAALAEKVRRM
jgi:hypothetical protein